LDLRTGFSVAPLQFFSVTGAAIALISLLLVLYLFVRRLIVGPEAQGLFTLFAIAFFLIGVTLLGLGVVGEYVGRIYEQVRQRPRYTVAAVLEDESGTARLRHLEPAGAPALDVTQPARIVQGAPE
jgi:undecaprenyl-phosphate 4-deoxy-4-formamido-L-arabinose transferase